MDQIKIGNFIAECRRAKGLTQLQLADRLGITDKAISKWERGIAMPDSSIMLELCDILKISVNELLSGERIIMENYEKQTERKLIELVKEAEVKDRQLLALEWVIGIFSCIILLAPLLVAAYAPIAQTWVRVLIGLSGVIPAFVGIFCALKIEQVAGYYECKCCGHRYVPSFRSVNLSMHMGRTRYMRCPECKEKSWQKKVISKE